MTKNPTDWYSSWFDTPFYHILYKDRDDAEARIFMDTLTQYLNIPEGGTVLDLACGKGRHSVYLSLLGYQVTGVDLSANSIAFAKQFEHENLHFEVHDMCMPFNKTFDAVFNLFTSFGYFDNEEDNLNTIKAIKTDLNDYGFGVIDFMNSNFVQENLVPEEVKVVDGITFFLKRYVQDGYILKDITFIHENKEYNYQEKVRALSLSDFETLFEQAGVYLLDVFGDYKLNKFNAETSERLVMIFK
ncbi:MAG: class I SAM-dependent methyltransferase [Flavobacteriales bacterium]|nr:class I SAM-dependent methyltransferase [Flavobacteriia bacterium]NCP04986.1 class I SAM-dependent methyltransferase [Flavobacteriales bacterium]PIV94172.1 MAG: SAM-dependent methyltransferase [Flavobacteriaceae bacterium CG17_big_fil_post_rev_8_21_14_2_50_33_15]PIY09608.1 MAG: SAM-dependent methyltransferase [Flavobacteriaceae bacterium CG_4_10_14_3_um_filter_33_47]PJB17389.1 MAG: SAM-dependent methyltransferase [Flavobacteriaceae bacterium CG_4_9_14_3_um_filter_33_16]